MKNPNCHKCTHRESVPGDTHSCCNHPYVKDNALAELACLMGVIAEKFFGGCEGGIFSPLNIEGDRHGIKQGWFNWPINFDPIWLKNCDGFEEKKNDIEK